MIKNLSKVFFVSLLISLPASAELTVSSVFADNMVLQRDAELRVWGEADAGDSVKVTFNGVTKESRVEDNGEWLLRLPNQSAGGPFEMTISSAGNTIEFKNILVGDVWVASGQSNMEWRMEKSEDGQADLEKGISNSNIRIFIANRSTTMEPQEHIEAEKSWVAANSSDLRYFSAVAWYFAEYIQKNTSVPVGIIQSARGGTRVNTWISHEANSKLSKYSYYQRAFQKYLKANPGDYKENYKKWKKGELKTQPKDPMHYYPGGYFNGMIAPLQPLSIKGVIWYQGETDRSKHELYKEYFMALIKDWRQGFQNDQLPFIYVQLPKFLYKARTPKVYDGNFYPYIREAQQSALELPHTAMAITIDTGTKDDIHPPLKKTVGERLAIAAMGVAYNLNDHYMGPIVNNIAINENRFEVSFDHVAKGLEFKGSQLKGFSVAGQDGVFVYATATISGSKVLVEAESIHEPKFIRYAWAGYPDSNLYNSAGLPASPFRNDKFTDLNPNAR